MENNLYSYGAETGSEGRLEALGGWQRKKILAFSPHADDLSIAAGGFLYLLGKSNIVQPVLGFTGWRGVNGGLAKEAAVQVREKEMTDEAKVLGFEVPIFLRLLSYEETDQVTCDQDSKKINELIHSEQPDIIFLPSKTDSQPRHRLLAHYVWQSVEGNESNIIQIYYETPWSLFSADQINLVVPLTEQMMRRKMKAIKAHGSQLVRTDFVKISRTMAEYRALTIPEQVVNGFGSQADMGKWIEIYRLEGYNKL